MAETAEQRRRREARERAQAAAASPPPPSVTTTEHPIGVSADYKPPSGRAIYMPGQENELIGGMSPEDRGDLQMRLLGLGLIAPKARIVLGSWDNPSANAMRQVLAYANSRGLLWYQALAEMEASSAGFGDMGGGAATPSRAATNPLDFQALAKNESRDVLGRGLSADELARVTGKLQGTEAPYLAGDNPVSPPGSGAFQEVAKQQVRALDPVRADSRSAVKVASVLAQMLAGRLPSESQQLGSG